VKSLTIIFGMVLVFVLTSNNAFATLIVDVSAVSGTNGALVVDSKNVIAPTTFDAANPAAITFQIFAYFTSGEGDPPGNSIQQIQGGMATIRDAVNYGFKGDISPISFASLWAGQSGTQPGIPTPNSVGDLTIPTTPAASVWSARNETIQPVDAVTLGLLIGTFTVTQTGSGGTVVPTTVNFSPIAGNYPSAGIWYENGRLYSFLSTPRAYQVYAAGAPVSILVPEPSTITLLLTLTIGGLFLWRRRF
jgi:hypothetical protein